MRSRGFLSSWSPLFLSHGGERHLAIESPNNKAPRVRVNRQIRISPIRVIAPDGAQLGVLTVRSEEHTSELQSHSDLVCRLLLEKKKRKKLQTQEQARTTATEHK